MGKLTKARDKIAESFRKFGAKCRRLRPRSRIHHTIENLSKENTAAYGKLRQRQRSSFKNAEFYFVNTECDNIALAAMIDHKNNELQARDADINALSAALTAETAKIEALQDKMTSITEVLGGRTPESAQIELARLQNNEDTLFAYFNTDNPAEIINMIKGEREEKAIVEKTLEITKASAKVTLKNLTHEKDAQIHELKEASKEVTKTIGISQGQFVKNLAVNLEKQDKRLLILSSALEQQRADAEIFVHAPKKDGILPSADQALILANESLKKELNFAKEQAQDCQGVFGLLLKSFEEASLIENLMAENKKLAHYKENTLDTLKRLVLDNKRLDHKVKKQANIIASIDRLGKDQKTTDPEQKKATSNEANDAESFAAMLSRMQEVVSENTKLTSNLALERERIRVANEKAFNVNIELGFLRNALRKSEVEHKAVKNVLDKKDKSYQSTLRKMKEALDAANAEVKAMRSKENTIANELNELAQVKLQLSDALQTVETKNQIITDMSVKREMLLANANLNLCDIEKELAERIRDSINASTEHSNLQKKHEIVSQELAKALSDKDALQQALTTALDEKETLQDRLDGVKKNLNQLKADIAAHANIQTSAERETDGQAMEILALKAKLASIEDSDTVSKQLVEEKKSLHARIEAISEKLSILAAQSDYKNEKIAQLTAELTASRAFVEKLGVDMENKNMTIGRLEKSVDDYKKNVHQLNSQNSSHLLDIRRLKRQLDSQKIAIDPDTGAQRFSVTPADYVAIKENLILVRKERNDFEDTLQSATARFDSMEAEIIKFKEDIDRKDTQVMKLRDELFNFQKSFERRASTRLSSMNLAGETNIVQDDKLASSSSGIVSPLSKPANVARRSVILSSPQGGGVLPLRSYPAMESPFSAPSVPAIRTASVHGPSSLSREVGGVNAPKVAQTETPRKQSDPKVALVPESASKNAAKAAKRVQTNPFLQADQKGRASSKEHEKDIGKKVHDVLMQVKEERKAHEESKLKSAMTFSIDGHSRAREAVGAQLMGPPPSRQSAPPVTPETNRLAIVDDSPIPLVFQHRHEKKLPSVAKAATSARYCNVQHQEGTKDTDLERADSNATVRPFKHTAATSDASMNAFSTDKNGKAVRLISRSDTVLQLSYDEGSEVEVSSKHKKSMATEHVPVQKNTSAASDFPTSLDPEKAKRFSKLLDTYERKNALFLTRTASESRNLSSESKVSSGSSGSVYSQPTNPLVSPQKSPMKSPKKTYGGLGVRPLAPAGHDNDRTVSVDSHDSSGYNFMIGNEPQAQGSNTGPEAPLSRSGSTGTVVYDQYQKHGVAPMSGGLYIQNVGDAPGNITASPGSDIAHQQPQVEDQLTGPGDAQQRNVSTGTVIVHEELHDSFLMYDSDGAQSDHSSGEIATDAGSDRMLSQEASEGQDDASTMPDSLDIEIPRLPTAPYDSEVKYSKAQIEASIEARTKGHSRNDSFASMDSFMFNEELAKDYEKAQKKVTSVSAIVKGERDFALNLLDPKLPINIAKAQQDKAATWPILSEKEMELHPDQQAQLINFHPQSFSRTTLVARFLTENREKAWGPPGTPLFGQMSAYNSSRVEQGATFGPQHKPIGYQVDQQPKTRGLIGLGITFGRTPSEDAKQQAFYYGFSSSERVRSASSDSQMPYRQHLDEKRARSFGRNFSSDTQTLEAVAYRQEDANEGSGQRQSLQRRHENLDNLLQPRRDVSGVSVDSSLYAEFDDAQSSSDEHYPRHQPAKRTAQEGMAARKSGRRASVSGRFEDKDFHESINDTKKFVKRTKSSANETLKISSKSGSSKNAQGGASAQKPKGGFFGRFKKNKEDKNGDLPHPSMDSQESSSWDTISRPSTDNTSTFMGPPALPEKKGRFLKKVFGMTPRKSVDTKMVPPTPTGSATQMGMTGQDMDATPRAAPPYGRLSENFVSLPAQRYWRYDHITGRRISDTFPQHAEETSPRFPRSQTTMIGDVQRASDAVGSDIETPREEPRRSITAPLGFNGSPGGRSECREEA